MMNLANPLQPQFAGCFSTDGYTHDAQCVTYHGPDTAHVGKEICMASNTDTLTIVDVTNKAAPVMLSRTTYAGVGYTHQGWLTDDQAHFLIDDELDETDFGHPTWTYIWNVSDLDAPFLMDHYTGPTAATDHNQYIHNGYSYQANYRAGLRVLDTADIATGNLSEVAYFDIYPSSNTSGFNGAWNNYPFFASGNVIVSGMDSGLFVVHPNLTDSRGWAGRSRIPEAARLPTGVAAVLDLLQVPGPGAIQRTVTTNGAAPGAGPLTVPATDAVVGRTRDASDVVGDLRLIMLPAILPDRQTPATPEFWSHPVAAFRARSAGSGAGTPPSWRSPPTT
jgi:hypothetical protein